MKELSINGSVILNDDKNQWAFCSNEHLFIGDVPEAIDQLISLNGEECTVNHEKVEIIIRLLDR